MIVAIVILILLIPLLAFLGIAACGVGVIIKNGIKKIKNK